MEGSIEKIHMVVGARICAYLFYSVCWIVISAWIHSGVPMMDRIFSLISLYIL